jgi:hypothetical protein
VGLLANLLVSLAIVESLVRVAMDKADGGGGGDGSPPITLDSEQMRNVIWGRPFCILEEEEAGDRQEVEMSDKLGL